MADINIYGTFKSQTGDGKLAKAAEIYDDALGKFQSEINQEGGSSADGIVYDVTANNSGATFASLSALLSSGSLSTLIPTDVRKGGMQICFVLTSDNKYVQCRYMQSDASTVATFTNVANWQGVDNEPTANSKNLVTSGGVRALLIKLKGRGANASAAGATVGDIFYNTSSKLLRLVLGSNNEITIPYLDGAIYTYNSDFWVWNGTDLIIAPNTIYNRVIELRTSIFKAGKALKKNGTTPTESGFYTTPFIPVNVGDSVSVGGYSGGTSYDYSLLCFYNKNKQWLSSYGNSGGDGFTELTMTVPENAAFMVVGSREKAGDISVLNNSYVEHQSYIILDALDKLATVPDDIKTLQSNVTKLNVYNKQVEQLGWDVQLKGNSNSYITCKSPIVLSQDGDSIEISFGNITTSGIASGGYAFTKSGTGTTGIFVWKTGVSIRSDDSTWIISSTGIGFGSGKTLKVEFADGNIKTYVDGELKNTYSGQKTITIGGGFGNGSSGTYGYWNGIIKSISVNGNAYDFADTFIFGSDANLYRIAGFLTDVQQEQLDSVTEKPKFVVKATSSQVQVFQHIHDNVYIGLNINHTVNSSDAAYVDYWRIGHASSTSETGQFYTYSAGVFTGLSKYPLNYVENEFAIQFYNNDFTGGAHGNERIDLNNSCYIVFILDGKEYSITDLVSLGTIQCSTFSYREKSILYSMYSVTETHDEIAEHVKITEFKNGGYVTKNHIKMLAALTAKNAYSGLVCVYESCSDFVVDNNGTVFEATHPSTSAQITEYKNDTNFVTKMYNGDISCVLDSKVVGGNVSSYNSASPKVNIFDRQHDTKYYATMPQNVSLQINDVFEFECIACWNYKLSNQ